MHDPKLSYEDGANHIDYRDFTAYRPDSDFRYTPMIAGKTYKLNYPGVIKTIDMIIDH